MNWLYDADANIVYWVKKRINVSLKSVKGEFLNVMMLKMQKWCYNGSEWNQTSGEFNTSITEN